MARDCRFRVGTSIGIDEQNLFWDKLTSNKRLRATMPMTIWKTFIDSWTGQAFTVWRKSIRRRWRGNLTPPSTTFITEMRISPWFKRGRSSLLWYLSRTSFGPQYFSLITLILSLEFTNLANLFALAILWKKINRKERKKQRRKRIKRRDVKTYRKERVWFSGFNTLGLLVRWRLREDEDNTEGHWVWEEVRMAKGASHRVLKGEGSHVRFGGEESFSPQNHQRLFTLFSWKWQIHHLKKDKWFLWDSCSVLTLLLGLRRVRTRG